MDKKKLRSQLIRISVKRIVLALMAVILSVLLLQFTWSALEFKQVGMEPDWFMIIRLLGGLWLIGMELMLLASGVILFGATLYSARLKAETTPEKTTQKFLNVWFGHPPEKWFTNPIKAWICLSPETRAAIGSIHTLNDAMRSYKKSLKRHYEERQLSFHCEQIKELPTPEPHDTNVSTTIIAEGSYDSVSGKRRIVRREEIEFNLQKEGAHWYIHKFAGGPSKFLEKTARARLEPIRRELRIANAMIATGALCLVIAGLPFVVKIASPGLSLFIFFVGLIAGINLFAKGVLDRNIYR